MRTLLQDIRYGLRVLLRKPGFTLVAVLTLALGVGANTAIFSVVNAVLLRPLPYEEPEQIVWLWENNPQAGATTMSISLPNLRDWKEQNRSFERIGATRGVNLALTGGGQQAERVQAAQAEADYFAAIGTRPLVGRTFLAEEDAAGGSRVAVLSHGLWQRRFGGDRDAVGKTINLDGESYEVVGVMPPEFAVLNNPTELWVPFGQFKDKLPQERDNHPGIFALARVRRGLTVERARSDMNAIAARLSEQYEESRGNGVVVTSVQEQMVQSIRPALLVLLGVVGFVLLIACANVASLLLARAAARGREIAIRVALGAGRMRIVRQLLTESLLLAFVGGAAGLVLALWGTDLLVASLPANSPIPRQDEIGIDARVLVFTVGVSLLSALVFGLAPAFQASKSNPNETLKEGGRGALGKSSRLRKALVVAEVALTLVLLVGAGLMLRSFARLQAVDPGFEPGNVLTMRINLPQTRYPERAQWTEFYRQLLERVRALPGVESASVSSAIPLASGGSEAGVIVEGRPVPRNPSEGTAALFQTVSPDYHETMGVTLLRGRRFNEQDTETSTPVVIIDETMARKFWPSEDPLGKRISFENQGTADDPRPNWREVVGVVRHVRHYQLERESFVELYAPVNQLPMWQQRRRPAMGLIVRAAAEPEAITSAIREHVRALDSEVPIYSVNTMTGVVDTALAQRRLSTWLLGIFACVALVLATVGIYGVLAYMVAQRTHEIGLRMALGAQGRDVLRLVVGQGMSLALVGVAVGLAAAYGLTRLMEGLLYGVSATDPATFAAVSLLLAAVALLAC
ncbi:MAG TPA: ABC transporter permease, partial [Pyrinomonadaceae bacterium]|nr:ABC transporter permease [Pyrinomonadaceae bacterium]